MSRDLLTELNTENLCTHFVLPLLKLNKFNYVASNFMNCYLTPDGKQVLVHVSGTYFLSRKVFLHPQYRGLRRHREFGYMYLIYDIPPKWRQDVLYFIDGRFSHMSKAAKDTIVRFSGLPFSEKRKDGKVVTDGRLLALERHKLLKQMWEVELSSTDSRSTGRIVLDDQEELLSIPGPESFIDPSYLVITKEAQL